MDAGENVSDLAENQPIAIRDAITGEVIGGGDYTSDPNILGGGSGDEHVTGLLGMPILATRDAGGGWLYVSDGDRARAQGLTLRCIVVTR